MPKEGCDPMGSPQLSRLLTGPVDPQKEEPMLEQKGPMLEQFVKNCSPSEGCVLEKFVEYCLLWEGPHDGAGEEHEEVPPNEEEEAEATCDELTTAPILHPPAFRGGDRENLD
ncbi:hypothetical protein llap_7316 [Limosa lapponica baueri]|uniref:Uncharacterized protein n=1 Tax=Limosa lapponica baueri TaxID=1758121 RepID=A0A2I0U8K3_LIMLA|nr:hypothetical protein llap_7316 [Limosa lapponica baueri]